MAVGNDPINKFGFTLIEMSITLVVIGLIVGGILTGLDLMNAAAIRAQISQIDKYNTAVRTFQLKYGYLPGDIPNPYASNFGFQSRGTLSGEGDGDGVLASNCSGALAYIRTGCAGELGVFWEDLSTAGLIDAHIIGQDMVAGNYPSTTNNVIGTISLGASPGVKDWLPAAKIGGNNFVYVYSLAGGGNYFAVSSVTSITWDIQSSALPGITVQQAYSIDSKIDDGLPASGSVNICYINATILSGNAFYASGGTADSTWSYTPALQYCTPFTHAMPYAANTCFDNGNTTGATLKYSLAQNAGAQNCALSFGIK